MSRFPANFEEGRGQWRHRLPGSIEDAMPDARSAENGDPGAMAVLLSPAMKPDQLSDRRDERAAAAGTAAQAGPGDGSGIAPLPHRPLSTGYTGAQGRTRCPGGLPA